ncbi:MAG: helix-turn-helix transcriptional regulator [Kiritimatiellae bacterium]|nr:helix-turn-helix transcriptional regulator [Kiritimatiellia bacterium]
MTKRGRADRGEETLSLARMVSGEMVRAIGALSEESLMGPWPEPLRRRRSRARFVPRITPEDHAHSRVELCHLLAGRCALSFRFEHYQLRAGDLGLFPPDVPHAETYSAKRTAYRLAWWLLVPDHVYFQVTDYTPRYGFRFVDRVTLRPLGRDARDACRRLRRFCTAPEVPPVLPLKEALLSLSVSVLRRLLEQVDKGLPQAHAPLIEQAKAFVAGNTDRALTISEVARAVLLSPNYLTTLFRKETGVSLGTWIRRERIARARELLATTELSVKDVAFKLGFEDPYAFSHAFKRTEGASPLHYRRRAR